jgi:CHAT domain
MLEPYHLTVRFRVAGDTTTLDLETDDGAGDAAEFTPPFGDDLPLVLRALDAAQFPIPMRPSWSFTQPEQERLRALGFWQGDRVVMDIHARVGRALLTALTNDSAAAAIVTQARAAAQASGQPLELVLRFPRAATTLADLPWEALWEETAGGTGLPLLLAQGSRSSCVRYLTLPRPLPPPRAPGATLKLLAVSPNAGIAAALRQQQRTALTQALQPHVEAGRVSLVMPEPPLTIGSLLDLVQHQQPDILSFYGHGEYHDGQGRLQLDTPDGGREWVGADRLAPLADTGLRLLLLHACRSDQAGETGLLTGTAPLLSALGLPAVVAMQSYIRIPAATRLQAVLCGGIAAGQSVQDALAWGRAVLYAEERDAASWYVPTLTIASRTDAPLYLLAPPGDPQQVDAAGAAALVQAGARRAGLRFRDTALGVAGVSTLALLAVSSVLPLAAGGFTVATITGLLGSLGGNVLAGWLAQWAEKNTRRVVWDDPTEQAVLGEMTADLEQRMAHDQALSDNVAALLERTAAIPAALDALATQVDAQTDLLLDTHDRLKAQEALMVALRADLRRGDLIQGRLHQLLMGTLAQQTETLLAAYSQGTERLSTEVQTVLAEVRALRDELRSASAPQPAPVAPQPTVKVKTGGIDFGNARIGSIGDVVAGDKIGGDKVMGDKVINYGAPRPADTAPAHIQQLIEEYTRRLRVLEVQAARAGYNARPEVLTEIDEIRAEIARLQALLHP